MSKPRFVVGDQVTGGEIEADHDHGKVVEVKGDRIMVAWSNGERVVHVASELQVDGSYCEICVSRRE